jgi:hypothetical protein
MLSPSPVLRIRGYLTQKIGSKLSEIWSGSWFFTHSRARIRGSKRQRIPHSHTQHCPSLLLSEGSPENYLASCNKRACYQPSYATPFLSYAPTIRFRLNYTIFPPAKFWKVPRSHWEHPPRAGTSWEEPPGSSPPHPRHPESQNMLHPTSSGGQCYGPGPDRIR